MDNDKDRSNKHGHCTMRAPISRIRGNVGRPEVELEYPHGSETGNAAFE